MDFLAGLKCNVVVNIQLPKIPMFEVNETKLMNQECKTVVPPHPLMPMDKNAEQCYVVKCDISKAIFNKKNIMTIIFNLNYDSQIEATRPLILL